MMRSGALLKLCVMGLLSLAVLAVTSASMVVGDRSGVASAGWMQGWLGPGMAGPMSMLLSKHVIYALAAVAAMGLASRVDVREFMRVRDWRNPVIWMLLLAMGLTAAAMAPGVGLTINGARRWLSLGPRSFGVTFQPSELVKWAMVLAMAWWCTRRQGAMHRFLDGLLPALAVIAVGCALIVIEDLGTAALVGTVAVVLLLAGGARWWQLALMVPPAGAAVVLAVVHSPYRLARITSFWHPWDDPLGTGYQAIQSMLAIAEGGLIGKGLGLGVQKFGYLPQDTSDFLFASICEEMGLAGAAVVIGLYLAVLWLGLGIVKRCRHTFGRLLGLGVLLTFGLQATINLAVVSVVVPTKGIALPLLSAGGTGWIVTAFALGLVASLDEAARIEEEDAAADALEDAGHGVEAEPDPTAQALPVPA